MQEKTGTPPPALENRPNLEFPLSHYYEVFQEVSRARSYTMGGPAPLSFREVQDYCQFFKVDQITSWVYYDYVMMIDNIWLDLQSAKAEKEKAKQKPSQNAGKVPKK